MHQRWLALLLVAPILLTGCIQEEGLPQADRGIACALFDPAGSAFYVALNTSQAQDPPANTRFVVEASRVDDQGRPGEPFERLRMPESGCVGVSLPEPGTYHVRASAEHPEDAACQWFDARDVTLPERGIARVELDIALACT